MANLYLDRAGAEGVVSQINELIEAMKENAQRIDQAIMNQMPEYWKGNAHDKAENTYLESYQAYLTKQVPEMVEQLNTFMNDCVATIADVDAQLAG